MPIFPSSLNNLLFSERHLGTLIKNQRGRAENSVDQIADDLLLSMPTEDMVSQIGDEVKLPPLVLDHNGIARSDPRFTNMVVGPGSRPITVNAHAYDVDFSYTGASGLFNHQPDTHDNSRPRAKLDSRAFEGTITITAVAIDGTAPEEIRRFIDNEVCLIEKYIGFQALQLDPFNSTDPCACPIICGSPQGQDSPTSEHRCLFGFHHAAPAGRAADLHFPRSPTKASHRAEVCRRLSTRTGDA